MNELKRLFKLFAMASGLGMQAALVRLPSIGNQYLYGLGTLTGLATMIPLIAGAVGAILGWPPVVSLAGLWSLMFLFLLGVFGSPLGILIDAITQGTPGALLSRERYITVVRGILLWETLAFLLLSIVPIRNNWAAVPTLLLALAFLIIATRHWDYKGTWLRPILYYGAMVLVACIFISFFYPNLTFGKGEKMGINLFMEARDMYMNNVPYPKEVLWALIAFITYKLYQKFFGGASGHGISHAGGGHGGGHGHGDTNLRGILIGAVVLIVLYVTFGPHMRDYWHGNAVLPQAQQLPSTGNWQRIVADQVGGEAHVNHGEQIQIRFFGGETGRVIHVTNQRGEQITWVTGAQNAPIPWYPPYRARFTSGETNGQRAPVALEYLVSR